MIIAIMGILIHIHIAIIRILRSIYTYRTYGDPPSYTDYRIYLGLYIAVLRIYSPCVALLLSAQDKGGQSKGGFLNSMIFIYGSMYT